MLSSAEVVFSSRILVTLLQYCVPLPSGLALFVGCFWIWILMMKIILIECSHFYKQVAPELESKLAVIFRHLLKWISFPTCWRLASVIPVLKESSSSVAGDYGPILITPILSKVFEEIETGKLSHFVEDNSLLPHSQFLYTRGLEKCNALLVLSHRLQVI